MVLMFGAQSYFMEDELVTETKKQEDQGSVTGNFIGGVDASIMSLPEAMAYGVLVFSALHPQYAAQGLLAGIIFANTYRRTNSLAMVTLEHSLYGNAIFAMGLGWN